MRAYEEHEITISTGYYGERERREEIDNELCYNKSKKPIEVDDGLKKFYWYQNSEKQKLNDFLIIN
jgi:hypothetical protein